MSEQSLDILQGEYYKLLRQRDELVEALKEALEWNWLDDDAPEELRKSFLLLVEEIEALK